MSVQAVEAKPGNITISVIITRRCPSACNNDESVPEFSLLTATAWLANSNLCRSAVTHSRQRGATLGDRDFW
jgi:hypothetical protein